MGFDTFCGNGPAVALLRSMMERNRLPHALIFSGPPGVGKYTLAQMLAKAVHCVQRENDYCGQCPSCLQIGMADDRWEAVRKAEEAREKLTKRPREVPLLIQHHPDVLLLPPNGPLRLFQIEQGRHLKQALAYRSSGGRKRVFLLPEADRMDRAAASSLLKSLEEPPSDALLLLTASSVAALLPTIQSRCVTISLGAAPRLAVSEFLARNGCGKDAAERDLRGALSGGCPGLALRMNLEHRIRVRDALLGILLAGRSRSGFAVLFAQAQQLAAQKEKLENLLEVLYSLFQDILHIVTRANGEPLRNVDRPKALMKMAGLMEAGELMRAACALGTLERNLRRNVPAQLALETLAVSLSPVRRMSSGGLIWHSNAPGIR